MLHIQSLFNSFQGACCSRDYKTHNTCYSACRHIRLPQRMLPPKIFRIIPIFLNLFLATVNNYAVAGSTSWAYRPEIKRSLSTKKYLLIDLRFSLIHLMLIWSQIIPDIFLTFARYLQTNVQESAAGGTKSLRVQSSLANYSKTIIAKQTWDALLQ